MRRMRQLAALAFAVVAGLAARGTPAPGANAVRLASGLRVVERETSLVPQDLTDFVFLGDGDLLVAGKNGEVKRVTRAGRSYYLAVLKVDADANRGLLSLALARDYPATGHLYTLATYRETGGQVVGRVERWTVDHPDAPTFMTDATTVLDGIPAEGTGDHTIDAVQVASDGSLFVSSGDGGSDSSVDPRSFQSLDLGTPLGKILHVTPDGHGVPTNPFYDPAQPDSWTSRVYALGLRNPFRFTLRPGTGVVYVGDVGWNDGETIAVVRPGDNLAWPCFEGGRPTVGYAGDPRCRTVRRPRTPLFTYAHGHPPPGDPKSAAVVGGVFVTARDYPSSLRGAYVFADFVRGDVMVLRVDARDRLADGGQGARIAHGPWMPTAVVLDPGGHVCVGDFRHSRVVCLEPKG
jgi:glucose/arabinose dehydrogenase